MTKIPDPRPNVPPSAAVWLRVGFAVAVFMAIRTVF